MASRLSECRICLGFSGSECADGIKGESLSPAAQRIFQTLRWEGDLGVCPECGTWYRYRYDCGYFEDDTYLDRVTHFEAGREPDVDLVAGDLSASHRSIREHAARSLAQHFLKVSDPSGIDRLLRRSEPGVSLAAMRCLRGGTGHVEALEANLAHEEAETREEAASLLATRGRPERTAPLLEHPDACVRRGALHPLSKPDVPALKAALHRRLADADPEVRTKAAGLLAEAADVNERIALLSHRVAAARKAAVLSLGDIRNLDVGPYVASLRPLLSSKDYSARSWAAIHLADHFLARNVRKEVEALLKHRGRDVRRWTLERLFGAKNRRSYLPSVTRLLLDPDQEIVRLACLFLGDPPYVDLGSPSRILKHFAKIRVVEDPRTRRVMKCLREGLKPSS